VGKSSSSFANSFVNASAESSSSVISSQLRASATMLFDPLTHVSLCPNSSRQSRHRMTLLDETKYHGASERPGKSLRTKSTRTNASSNTE